MTLDDFFSWLNYCSTRLCILLPIHALLRPFIHPSIFLSLINSEMFLSLQDGCSKTHRGPRYLISWKKKKHHIEDSDYYCSVRFLSMTTKLSDLVHSSLSSRAVSSGEITLFFPGHFYRPLASVWLEKANTDNEMKLNTIDLNYEEGERFRVVYSKEEGKLFLVL